MSRKRLALMGLVVVAALTAVGVAAAGKGTSVQAASATFSAPNVSRLNQVTCSITGGDTFQATRAVYKGESVSNDPRLAGALTIRAWSLVDTSNGVGHVFGLFRIKGPGTQAHGTLNAALANGDASGIARGFVRHRWGRIVASLGSTFDPNSGFSTGSLGGSTAGAGFIRSGRWCAPPHWPQS